MTIEENKSQIIEETEKYIRSVFIEDGAGHDWWHIYRVRNMAVKIAEVEGGDLFIIEMAALLHDLDDWKINHTGNSKIRLWLEKMQMNEYTLEEIVQNTEQVSFKGAGELNKANSLEAKIVQDADRLDAIGAIGIARTFAYGGSKGRLIYHPEIKPELHADFEAYKKGEGPTINHFYEKLLLLKDRLNTTTARNFAEKRHQFMEDFLEQFYREWDAKN